MLCGPEEVCPDVARNCPAVRVDRAQFFGPGPDAERSGRVGPPVCLIGADEFSEHRSVAGVGDAEGDGRRRGPLSGRTGVLRVRERNDVDLILGQGMLSTGWHAHTLNAPGKFLISAPEHQTPKRARGYLVTDQAVTDTVSRYADSRPALDEASQRAIEDQHSAGPPGASAGDLVHSPSSRTERRNPDDIADAPGSILWAALSLAPGDGPTVPELMDMTGMSRPWIYLPLRELTEQRQVIQVSRGLWRAVTGDVP